MYKPLIAEWYERYKTGLFRFALSILGDTQLAEDVLQETFLRLLSGKYSPEPGREQAWLYRVARNLCYDILRRQKREQSEVRAEGRTESGYEFVELLTPLRPKDREIISLKVLGGLTHREIAQVLGLTEHAVKKRYERSIKALREQEV